MARWCSTSGWTEAGKRCHAPFPSFAPNTLPTTDAFQGELTRHWDMKQKLAILLFVAFGLVVWYFVFTDEGQELGEDFVAWIDDIVKF